MNINYLESAIKQFQYYKMLADKTLDILNEDDILWRYDEESNSIAVVVKHLVGNMLSRWTNFLTEDGEKEWRNRDAEFQNAPISKAVLLNQWEKGWNCLFEALTSLKPEDLEKIIYIRNQGHTILEGINRQLAHYPYHIGQIVYIGKMIKGKKWVSLSIPKGNSTQYNQEKFNKEKGKRHFTDDL